MSRFRVLLTDRAWPDSEVEQSVLSEIDAEIIEAPTHDEATLISLAHDVDAIITCWAQVTGAVIEACPNCQIVARAGIGLDNIDIATATARNIPVTNVPAYCVDEVTEHTLAMMLAAARNVAFFHWRTKHGEYNLQAGGQMNRVAGQTLGIFGFGRIGQALSVKAKGLGLHVIATNQSNNNHGVDCEMVAFDELLERSDFISINAPLTALTHHQFNADAFAKMKTTAVLVNTSRGGLIDHDALWNVIQDDQLATVCLDVYDPEPPDLNEPLYKDERVILTPHAAFASKESLVELRRQTAKCVLDRLSGRQPQNVVNGVERSSLGE
ncbi:MAG: dehydrogenase [Planctomycetaceae bacterium]|nr:dehydrogenase [Planctomycetaceae bacterium]